MIRHISRSTIVVAVICPHLACNTSSPPNTTTTEPHVVVSAANVAPASPATSVAPAAAPASTAEARTYAVFGVKPNDVLNVRAQPDHKSAKVYSFGPGVKRVKSTGNVTKVGTTPWIEVAFDGGTGWVNRQFLTEVEAGGGCNDAELTAAIRKLMRSVDSLDGGSLEELVSPMRGLVVRYSSASPDVRYPQDQVGGLYASSSAKEWGTTPQNMNIKGPFKNVLLKDMKEAVAGKGSQEKCGKLILGGGAVNAEWPEDLPGLTQVSFHRPGAAWHTTVAGFEYVDGKPYLAALVGYRQGT